MESIQTWMNFFLAPSLLFWLLAVTGGFSTSVCGLAKQPHPACCCSSSGLFTCRKPHLLHQINKNNSGSSWNGALPESLRSPDMTQNATGAGPSPSSQRQSRSGGLWSWFFFSGIWGVGFWVEIVGVGGGVGSRGRKINHERLIGVILGAVWKPTGSGRTADSFVVTNLPANRACFHYRTRPCLSCRRLNQSKQIQRTNLIRVCVSYDSDSDITGL